MVVAVEQVGLGLVSNVKAVMRTTYRLQEPEPLLHQRLVLEEELDVL